MPSTHSMTTKIAAAGPFAGWDFTLTRHEHDIDAMEDRYTIAVIPPDPDTAAHQFETYRYGYGWHVIDAALTATDGRVDARLENALTWWTEHHTTTPYALHRILVAIDNTTWASRPEIAQHLGVELDDLRPRGRYGKALAAAEHHGLIAWRDTREGAAYAALTPNGYRLVHPDDQHAGDAGRRQLEATASAGKRAKATMASTLAARAFPQVDSVRSQLASASPGTATRTWPSRSPTR